MNGATDHPHPPVASHIAIITLISSITSMNVIDTGAVGDGEAGRRWASVQGVGGKGVMARLAHPTGLTSQYLIAA